MAMTEKDWYQKGLQLKCSSHYQKAIHAFDQAIDHKIKLAEAYYERALCFYKLGNSHRPRNAVKCSAKLTPEMIMNTTATASTYALSK